MYNEIVNMNSTMHRVRMYNYPITMFVMLSNTPDAQLRIAQESFSKTLEAAWIVRNQVEVSYEVDVITLPYIKQITFLADLNDKQYTDYVLRGFDLL